MSGSRDDPERRPAGGHPLDVVERVAEGLRPVLPGRARHVRGDDHVLEAEEGMVRRRRLLGHHVEPGPTQVAGRDRLLQRRLVDHGAAARVDEDGVRLHGRELARGHQAPRGVGERHVHRHDVGGAQQLLEEDEAHAERVFLVLAEPHDVVVLHAGVETVQPPRHLLADAAEADDADRLPTVLPSSSWSGTWSKPPTRHLLETTLPWHQVNRLSTARMSMSVCSSTETEFDPPLLQTGMPERRAAARWVWAVPGAIGRANFSPLLR